MIRFTKDFFKRRLIQPLLNFLKQGITPTKLALAVALGFAFGIFPVIGSTIVLCTVFGFALRLNIPAIQLINGFVYPLQLILYIPFFHIGAWLFQTEPIPFSLDEIFSMLANDAWGTIQSLWTANVRAMAAWMLFVTPLAFVLYYISRFVFEKTVSRKANLTDQPSPAGITK